MELSYLPKVPNIVSGRTRLPTHGADRIASISELCVLPGFQVLQPRAGLQVRRPGRCHSSARTRLGIQAPSPSCLHSAVVLSPDPDSPSSPVVGQTLSLKNISTDTSGYYLCTSSNEVGTESCNITVTVRPRKST